MSNIINHKRIPKLKDARILNLDYNDWDNSEFNDEDDDFDLEAEDSEDDIEYGPGRKRKKVRRKVKPTEPLETERRYLILRSDGTYHESNKPGGMKHWMIGSNEKISSAIKRLGL